MCKTPWQPLANALQPLSILKSHRPVTGEAAVLLLLLDKPRGPQLLLTLRAAHLSQHGGEVAFPGGKWEPGDKHLFDTVRRESLEEIALNPAQVSFLGTFAARQTNAGVRVTPVVGVATEPVSLAPESSEVAAIFTVPIEYFCHTNAKRFDQFTRAGVSAKIPAYQVQDRHIWGLTAAFATELATVYSAIMG